MDHLDGQAIRGGSHHGVAVRKSEIDIAGGDVGQDVGSACVQELDLNVLLREKSVFDTGIERCIERHHVAIDLEDDLVLRVGSGNAQKRNHKTNRGSEIS